MKRPGQGDHRGLEGELVVVTRMGRARRVIPDPGCYAKWFWPFERAHHFDGRRRLFNPTFTETLTRSGETILAERVSR